MANHTTEGTGVLRLTAVTPVIKALFAGYGLDADYPGDGKAYIRSSTSDFYPTWEGVSEQLQRLAEGLGVTVEGDEPEELGALILALAVHYANGKGVEIPLIDPELGDDAHLDELFEIAQVMDDGHGLVSLEMEAASYCSRPILGEFGGHGLFVGRGVVGRSGSHTALLAGQKLNEAVVAKDVDASVAILRQQLAETLSWITDPEVKLEVAKRLGLPA